MLRSTPEVRLFDLVHSLSEAIDLVSTNLVNHHKQTAYISSMIAKQLGLDRERQLGLVLAAMIHDIGALPLYETIDLLIDLPQDDIDGHARLGAQLLEGFQPLAFAADIIRFHHKPWDAGQGANHHNGEVHLESHILHLADRVSLLLDMLGGALGRTRDIVDNVHRETPSIYHPLAVDAFENLAGIEAFWFDLASATLGERLSSQTRSTTVELDLDNSLEFTKIVSRVIDFRSRYTSTHSAGVAATAQRLSRAAGFSKREAQTMLLAGHLHDLGKLAVPQAILEKPGKLTRAEFDVMRRHPYDSYKIINAIPGFERIATWAALHHERVDDRGYPFHIPGDELSLGSRIMAVADVYTALREQRPYREAMPSKRALAILHEMVQSGALDGNLTQLLEGNIVEIDEARRKAQLTAGAAFESFHREFLTERFTMHTPLPYVSMP